MAKSMARKGAKSPRPLRLSSMGSLPAICSGSLDPREDEVSRLVVVEVHGAAAESACEQNPVGLLHQLGEPSRVLLAAHDIVLRVLRLSDPAVPAPIDEVLAPDHPRPVVLKAL